MNKAIVFALVAGLAGCSPPEAETFARPQALTDGAGHQYIVKHHIGGTFTVELMPALAKEQP